MKEENKNLNNKVKTLESELNKKKDKIDDLQHSLSVSNTKLSLIKLIVINPDKKVIFCRIRKSKRIIQYLSIWLSRMMEMKNWLKIVNLQLMNQINGLSLEKYETQNSVEITEEIILKFKVDLESIELNEDIGVKLKLIDDKKKVIDSVKCQINIKIDKGK